VSKFGSRWSGAYAVDVLHDLFLENEPPIRLARLSERQIREEICRDARAVGGANAGSLYATATTGSVWPSNCTSTRRSARCSGSTGICGAT
jgi:hypothetical protein